MSKRGPHSLVGDSDSAPVPGRSRRSVVSTHYFEGVCAAVASRLRARLPELEAGLASLIDAVPDPRDDPAYIASLRAVRAAVLEYVIDAIEMGEQRAAGIPPVVLGGARAAARSGIALDTFLRRYSAGNALFSDILVEEAERAEVSSAALRRLLHRQATIFNHLLEVVSEEHSREAKSRPTTSAGWRYEYVKGLLAGRLPSGEADLEYDLNGHHIGLMVRGEGAQAAMRELAKRLDRRLLATRCEDGPVWPCWLGGRSPLESNRVLRAVAETPVDQLLVAVGESGTGLSGWRLSHRQAEAALLIGERVGKRVVRYADVSVLAAILRDDLSAISLRQLYLEPLENGRDGGKAARETLRAYFAAERNISSTAAALGVDRSTVGNRLRAIEERFNRPLRDFATDLEVALRLVD